MNNQDKAILVEVANLAGSNKAIYSAVAEICLQYSDGNYNALLDTYEYLLKENPEDVAKFIGGFQYLVKVSK